MDNIVVAQPLKPRQVTNIKVVKVLYIHIALKKFFYAEKFGKFLSKKVNL
ncbi:hypothetical protein J671_0957 [Acinetobacter sp. 1130196]|nr:hypothetical protein J525_0271 [Acinetobacter sp. 21871]EXE77788.1 hypothetical protein J582_1649 [Acinetobacter sp. 1566109]EXR19216.1 hypothetical protein J671_0957 [Acinetobacter sp. 1130196]EXR65240.1 hypothetical protein J678_0714 [Acinetobacter sp. 1424608]EXT69998.1 hypothetical protein J813_2277 [Acinetobacter sp. 25977_10]KCX92599.1 hypothetical protein J568_2411 [Acinetobacter baumannii 6112]KCY48382.1 hypothetical protein J715_2712 [Acinetobacter baumannii 1571545]